MVRYRRVFSRELVTLVTISVACATVPLMPRCVDGEDSPMRNGVERRMAMERRLDLPLDWPVVDREHVTLGELLAHLRERHQLMVQWDIEALRLVLGEDSPLHALTGRQPAMPSYPELASVSSGETCLTCEPVGYGVPMGSPPVMVPPTLEVFGAPNSTISAAGPSVTASATWPSSMSAPVTPSRPPDPLSLSQQTPAAPTPSAPAPTQPASTQPASGKPVTSHPDAIFSPPIPRTDIHSADWTNPVHPKPIVVPTPLQACETLVVAEPNSAGDSERAEDQIARILEMPISTNIVALEQVSVEEGLRQLLAAVSPVGAMHLAGIGIPMTTRGLTFDLLVTGHSVMITTTLRAHSTKETRVYRLDPAATVSGEDLVRVITHTVRPWSWRGHSTEIAERLASRWPKESLHSPLVQWAQSMTFPVTQPGIGSWELNPAGDPETKRITVSTDDGIAALGQLLAGGADAVVHSLVAALEIVHHGDPPTGVIEAIPGFLVITQSQAAHREIRQLLDQIQLSD